MLSKFNPQAEVIDAQVALSQVMPQKRAKWSIPSDQRRAQIKSRNVSDTKQARAELLDAQASDNLRMTLVANRYQQQMHLSAPQGLPDDQKNELAALYFRANAGQNLRVVITQLVADYNAAQQIVAAGVNVTPKQQKDFEELRDFLRALNAPRPALPAHGRPDGLDNACADDGAQLDGAGRGLVIAQALAAIRQNELKNLIKRYNALVQLRDDRAAAGAAPANALDEMEAYRLKLLAEKLSNLFDAANEGAAPGQFDGHGILGTIQIPQPAGFNFDTVDITTFMQITGANTARDMMAEIFTDPHLARFDNATLFTFDPSNITPIHADPIVNRIHNKALELQLPARAQALQAFGLARFQAQKVAYKTDFTDIFDEIDLVRGDASTGIAGFEMSFEGLAEFANDFFTGVDIQAANLEPKLGVNPDPTAGGANYSPQTLFQAYNLAKGLDGSSQAKTPLVFHSLHGLAQDHADYRVRKQNFAKVMSWHVAETRKSFERDLAQINVNISPDCRIYKNQALEELQYLAKNVTVFVNGQAKPTPSITYDDITRVNGEVQGNFSTTLREVRTSSEARFDLMQDRLQESFEASLQTTAPVYFNECCQSPSPVTLNGFVQQALRQPYQAAVREFRKPVEAAYQVDFEAIDRTDQIRYNDVSTSMKDVAQTVSYQLKTPQQRNFLMNELLGGNHQYFSPNRLINLAVTIGGNRYGNAPNSNGLLQDAGDLDAERRRHKDIMNALIAHAQDKQGNSFFYYLWKASPDNSTVFRDLVDEVYSDIYGGAYPGAGATAVERQQRDNIAKALSIHFAPEDPTAPIDFWAALQEIDGIDRTGQAYIAAANGHIADGNNDPLRDIWQALENTEFNQAYDLQKHTLSYLLYDPESIDKILVENLRKILFPNTVEPAADADPDERLEFEVAQAQQQSWIRQALHTDFTYGGQHSFSEALGQILTQHQAPHEQRIEEIQNARIVALGVNNATVNPVVAVAGNPYPVLPGGDNQFLYLARKANTYLYNDGHADQVNVDIHNLDAHIQAVEAVITAVGGIDADALNLALGQLQTAVEQAMVAVRQLPAGGAAPDGDADKQARLDQLSELHLAIRAHLEPDPLNGELEAEQEFLAQLQAAERNLHTSASTIKAKISSGRERHMEAIHRQLTWGQDRKALAGCEALRNLTHREQSFSRSQDVGVVIDPMDAVRSNVPDSLAETEQFTRETETHKWLFGWGTGTANSQSTYTRIPTTYGRDVQRLRIPVIAKERDAARQLRVMREVRAFVERGGLRGETINLEGMLSGSVDARKLAVTIYACIEKLYPDQRVEGVYAVDLQQPDNAKIYREAKDFYTGEVAKEMRQFDAALKAQQTKFKDDGNLVAAAEIQERRNELSINFRSTGFSR